MVLPANDSFKTLYGGPSDLTWPATKAAAVTPHDTNELAAGPCRALYIGGAGNVAVVLAEDSSPVTFVGATAGSVLPLRAKVVRSTSTTATNIVALY